MAASSGSGGEVEGAPDTGRAELQSQLASVRRAREHVHPRPFGNGDLRSDVCGAAESVYAEPAARRQP